MENQSLSGFVPIQQSNRSQLPRSNTFPRCFGPIHARATGPNRSVCSNEGRQFVSTDSKSVSLDNPLAVCSTLIPIAVQSAY